MLKEKKRSNNDVNPFSIFRIEIHRHRWTNYYVNNVFWYDCAFKKTQSKLCCILKGL